MAMSVAKEMENNIGVVDKSINPISWLIGKWKTVPNANGSYPTIKSFQYGEELQFRSLGQCYLSYTGQSFNPEDGTPIHLEAGFLRIQPDTDKVSLVLAHNIGFTTVEEGVVSGTEINFELQDSGYSACYHSPKIIKTKKVITLIGDVLEQRLTLHTENTPMTPHLIARYKKVE